MSVQAPAAPARPDSFAVAALAAAALVHGLLSAPVPQALGAAELLVGGLLLAATGAVRPLQVAAGCGERGWPADTRRCLAAAVLLWLPLLVGLAAGNTPAAVLRDLVPLGFVLLPLALPLGPSGQVPPRLLATLFAASGVAMALRHLALTGAIPGRPIALAALPAAPEHYLANGNLVLFAAVWLPLLALRLGRSGPGWGRRVPAALAAAMGAAIAASACAVTLQRAALILALLAWLYAVAAAAWSRPGRPAAVAAVLAGLAGLAFAGDALAQLAGLLTWKTQLVGVNTRLAEIQGVLAQLAHDPAAILAGFGWGHLWPNPAAGLASVGYTHNAVTYLWLKTGLIGLLAAGVAVIGPALAGWARLWRQDRDLALALAAALGTGSLIHADFKTLGFGLLVTLAFWGGQSPAMRAY